MIYDSIYIVGWSVILHRNAYQLDLMREVARDVKVLVTVGNYFFENQKAKHPKDFHILSSNPFSRLRILFAELNGFGDRNVCILAPLGRFAIIYLIIARIKRFKVISVEWGDLYQISEASRINRMIYLYVMKKSDLVWYKEPYMEKLLHMIPVKKMFFLPNAAPTPRDSINEDTQKRVDFLWCNRNIQTRYPEALLYAAIEVVKNHNVRFLFLGLFLTDVEIDQWLQGLGQSKEKLLKSGIEFKKYQDPLNFMLNAKFFVMLADNIFGNNALLESMQLGLVPIVSNSNSTSKVVEKHGNGFVTNHDLKSLVETLELAISMDFQTYKKMSKQNVIRIESEFSISSWDVNCREMFKSL
jgi:glycosyltransferase involved in cell wall biosynthesis